MGFLDDGSRCGRVAIILVQGTMRSINHTLPIRALLVVLAVIGILLPCGPTPAQDAPAASAREKLSQLGGRAYLGRNAPVVGATVLVWPEERNGEVYLTSTDENGVFRVDGLPDGSYSLRVEREGLAAKAKDGIPLKFPFRAVVELNMDPLAPGSAEASAVIPDATAAGGPLSLKGLVVEEGAGPMGEVQLRFVRTDGREDPRGLRSLRDGTFEVTGAGAGVWRLEVSAVGYLSQRLALDLQGAAFLKVILVRQPADYDPTPLELMPPEQPIPPEGFVDDTAGLGGDTAEEADPDDRDDGTR